MTVTAVRKDVQSRTITLEAEFEASPERVWQLWADPRQLERWWGPPTYPATVVDHDLARGGRVTYFMTGPEGEKFHGYWEVQTVEPPRRLVLKDGFADDSGAPNDSMPTTTTQVTLRERDGGGTVMVVEARFPSLEAMEKMLSMGMEEGFVTAMGQIDAILADS